MIFLEKTVKYFLYHTLGNQILFIPIILFQRYIYLTIFELHLQFSFFFWFFWNIFSRNFHDCKVPCVAVQNVRISPIVYNSNSFFCWVHSVNVRWEKDPRPSVLSYALSKSNRYKRLALNHLTIVYRLVLYKCRPHIVHGSY